MAILASLALVLCAVHFICARSLSSSSSSSSSKAPQCNDPARETLEELWESQRGFHESLYSVRNVLEGMKGLTLDNVPKEFVHIKHSPLDASSAKCPHDQNGEPKHTHDKTNITLCPSYDIISHDENRIPPALFEKKCSCQNCRGIKNTTTGCVEIKYHTKVLRRTACSNNEYIYKLVLEPLVVACACDHSSRHEEQTSKNVVHTSQQ